MFIVQSKHDEWQMDNNIYCEQYNTEASRYGEKRNGRQGVLKMLFRIF